MPSSDRGKRKSCTVSLIRSFLTLFFADDTLRRNMLLQMVFPSATLLSAVPCQRRRNVAPVSSPRR